MSIKRGQIAEKIYSAQRCVNGSDCQTEPELKGSLKRSAFPVEKSPNLAPLTLPEKTIISAGGCRFIVGPVGKFQCGCRDPRQCHKNKDAAVLELTPRCFLYHDRFVQAVPA